jgi:hypothetical protein
MNWFAGWMTALIFSSPLVSAATPTSTINIQDVAGLGITKAHVVVHHYPNSDGVEIPDQSSLRMIAASLRFIWTLATTMFAACILLSSLLVEQLLC